MTQIPFELPCSFVLRISLCGGQSSTRPIHRTEGAAKACYMVWCTSGEAHTL